jgi:hypothetical protein
MGEAEPWLRRGWCVFVALEIGTWNSRIERLCTVQEHIFEHVQTNLNARPC